MKAIINTHALNHKQVSECLSPRYSPKYLYPFQAEFPILFLDLKITENIGTTCWWIHLWFWTTCTQPFCNCSRQFEWLQILQSTRRYAIIFSFPGQNVCGDFQLTMQGKEMESHTQTLTEAASAPQQTQSCRITTNQQSKHKMLMEINYPLRAVYLFFFTAE